MSKYSSPVYADVCVQHVNLQQGMKQYVVGHLYFKKESSIHAYICSILWKDNQELTNLVIYGVGAGRIVRIR
jgi:hypothetical protein